jgi:hypothetical protein
MSVVGMLSGDASQSADGVGIDADEPPCGADATALIEVLEDGDGLLLGEMGVEQSRPLAFGEAVFAGVAVKQSDVVLFAVAGADREIPGMAPTVGGADGVLTAEASEVVHGKT